MEGFFTVSVIIDIILIAILLWKVIRGFVKGLTGILLGLASLVISFIAAIIFGPAISDGSAGIIMYVVVFVVSYIVCSIITHLLCKVKIPIAHAVNKLLGTILGFAVGAIMVSLIAIMLYGILFVLDKFTGDSVYMDIYNNSHIFKFIYDFNIFGFVKDMLM